jgi:hypothetical protein
MQATSAEAVANAVAATQTHSQSPLVQSSLSHNRKYTTSTVSPRIMTTMASLRKKLSASGQDPSPRQLSALQDVVEILAAMADGTCRDATQLFSLDPHLGKVTTLITLLGEVVRSKTHSDTGALVCPLRIDEVKRLVEEAGLDEHDFAMRTSDEKANSLSATPRNEAQVLFTTQQMLMKRDLYAVQGLPFPWVPPGKCGSGMRRWNPVRSLPSRSTT